MIVVSNATPLIFLGKLNAVHVLQSLYHAVLISPKVYYETIVSGLQYGHSDAIVLNLYYQKGLFQIETSFDTNIVTQLETDSGLDADEAETIALAIRKGASLALIDELKARQAAREKGLTIKGTLGVLFEACMKGLIDPMQTEMYLQQIMQRDDIWISTSLCVSVLEKIRS